MLSLVVTVLLFGLAVSDPLPGPHYPGPIHPIAHAGHGVNALPSSKYHKEQVPLLQQHAVGIPQVKVVTNERVKVVTERKNVPIPIYKVKEVVKHIPIKKLQHVPVMVHNKELVPVIKKQINTVVKEVPKVITNTVVQKVPMIQKVPQIRTKHINHVRTKVLHKPVPRPYAYKVDNPVAVPKPVYHKVHVKVPVPFKQVEVKTRTKVVDRPVYRTVVREKPVHHTVVKTVNRPVPNPIPFVQTKIVKQAVPQIKTVVQHHPVPQIFTKHHVKNVPVPMVKQQTVVKHVPKPHLVKQYVDRVHTVEKKVPVGVPVVHKQHVPMIQEKIVPRIIEKIRPQIVVKDRVHTVVKNHVQQVPKIIRQVVDRPYVQKVVVPKPQIILKETHKEVVQPVQVAEKASVRYYQIDSRGQRIPISPGYVSSRIVNTGQSGMQVHGGNIVGVAGVAGIGVDPRISGIQSGMSSASSRGISMEPGVLAGIAASRGTHGGARGQIGTLNLQQAANFGFSGGNMMGANAGLMNHPAAAMMNIQAQQAALAAQGGVMHHSQYPGMPRSRFHHRRIFTGLNQNSDKHILAKVTGA